jgi:hypothetical protein
MCARRTRTFQLVIAQWGSRSADLAEEAANIAAVATTGDAVGESCGLVQTVISGPVSSVSVRYGRAYVEVNKANCATNRRYQYC